MSSKKSEVVHARIPLKLRRAMNAYIFQGNHISESDFIRTAIVERLKQNAPYLLEEKK